MLILTLALVLDWYVGEPKSLWSRVPHPVAVFGKIISWADRRRYSQWVEQISTGDTDRDDLFLGGALLVGLFVICIVGSALLSWLFALLDPFWWFAEILIISVFIAQKSLFEHVTAVVHALKTGDVNSGREAVALIVGRNTSQLNSSGIAKASIESLAENTSDGIVAPVFWYAVFGLPGLLFYKAVNTADSMVGHKNEKYEWFGKPAAILDDVLNWPAARLTALLVVVVVAFRDGFGKAKTVWNTTLRDAGGHRSPNAGWPETAFAAALDISLGGVRVYQTEHVNGHVLNASGRDDLSAIDITIALDLFRHLCFGLMGLCFLLWLVF